MHHVAIVYSARGVLFLSVARSRAARDRALARYVREHADHQLSPRTRDEVVELMRRDAIPEAVRKYFEAVGREWDDEWLHLDSVEDPTPTTVTKQIQAIMDEPPRAAAQVRGG